MQAVRSTASVQSGPSERTILRGAWGVPGDIVIEDGRIAAIGAATARAGDEVVDCTTAIITAGLINTHHHLAQLMTRGQAVNLDLANWLRALYPRWGRMDTEDVHAAALVGLIELALSGCTLTVDHHYVVPNSDDSHFDAIADAAQAVGIRLYLARGSIDLDIARGGLAPSEFVEDADEALRSMDEVAHRLHDGERTWVALAPNSPHSASFELMRGAAQLAAKRGLRLHTHLSETAAVVDLYRERFGATPVQVLEDLGWLESTTWVAHATHLTEDELTSVVRSGMGVSHCPSGNARLGTGIGPVAWLREQGVPVGLGVDGGAVNEASAIMPEMRQALYLARLRAADTAALSPADAFDAATRGGAACLGLADRFGTLEVGRLADLVVWPAADLLDFPDPVTGLVFGPARRAREVYVGGRAIVRDGAVLRVDVEAAYRNLQRRSQRLRTSHSSQ